MIWVVARTKTRRERYAAENVDRQGCEYYLPQILEMRSAAGKRGEAHARPLFPGYLFVRTDGQWHFLLNTFGISNVILFGGEPAMMSDAIIDDIRSREQDGCVVLPAGQQVGKFRIGQSVRVREGLFSGLTGIYEGNSAASRERVLLEYLGRKTKVLIAPDNLEAA